MSVTRRVRAINRVAIPAEAPGRFQIMPWGKYLSGVLEGEPVEVTVDDETAGLLIGAFNARGIDVVIDYHHQSEGLNLPPDGIQRAAGWIKKLEAVPGDGIYAICEWTPRGAELIAQKELRYPSWAGDIRDEDLRPVEITSVALTNKPFIDGMKPIVNSAANVGRGSNVKENAMNNVVKALGLADGADETAVVAAINERRTKDTERRAVLCRALGIAESADDAALLAAVNEAKAAAKKAATAAEPDPTKFVPIEAHRQSVERLAKVEGDLTAINCAEFITQGQNDGRLCDANKATWEARFKANPADAREAIKLVPEGTYPKNGRVVNSASATSGGGATGGGDRTKVINEARRQYDDNRVLHGLTSRKAFVLDALRQAKHEPALTKDEETLVPA